MSGALKLIAVTLLALALHLVLGWWWTAVAALIGGYWIGRRGWMLGAAAVGFDYLALVLYSYAADPRAFGVMTDTMGALVGNLPGAAIVAVTLAIGAATGALAGAAGSRLRRVVELRPAPANV